MTRSGFLAALLAPLLGYGILRKKTVRVVDPDAGSGHLPNPEEGARGCETITTSSGTSFQVSTVYGDHGQWSWTCVRQP